MVATTQGRLFCVCGDGGTNSFVLSLFLWRRSGDVSPVDCSPSRCFSLLRGALVRDLNQLDLKRMKYLFAALCNDIPDLFCRKNTLFSWVQTAGRGYITPNISAVIVSIVISWLMAVMIEGRALWSSGDCAFDSKQALSYILPPPERAGLPLHRSKQNNPNLDFSNVFVFFVLFCFLFLFEATVDAGKRIWKQQLSTAL